MIYIIIILIGIALIANFTGSIDSTQFSILVIGLTIMNMILGIEDKLDDILKKLSAEQKEKEEK